eukprot:257849_1
MNTNCALPTDLVSIILECVPSCTLKLLQANNGFTQSILQAQNIWRHLSVNLYADLERILNNNPLIELQSIAIPNTPWLVHYQDYKKHKDHDEMIYLNIYISIQTMNQIIVKWITTKQ